MIKLCQLCSFRVYMLWFSTSMFSKYEMCAKLYYINIHSHSFEFCLYVVPNLNALLKVRDRTFIFIYSILSGQINGTACTAYTIQSSARTILSD